MKRVKRAFYGVSRVIPPQKGGALAQCAFCEWGVFLFAKARHNYQPLHRAFARLRAHAKKHHADKFLKISTAAEILGGE